MNVLYADIRVHYEYFIHVDSEEQLVRKTLMKLRRLPEAEFTFLNIHQSRIDTFIFIACVSAACTQRERRSFIQYELCATLRSTATQTHERRRETPASSKYHGELRAWQKLWMVHHLLRNREAFPVWLSENNLSNMAADLTRRCGQTSSNEIQMNNVSLLLLLLL